MQTIKKLLTAFLLVMLAACTTLLGNQTPDIEILPDFKALTLSGKLIFIINQPDGNVLARFDLQTGQIETLFAAPKNSWLASAAVSPDRQEVIIAYAPPPENNEIQFGRTGLYRLPVDGPPNPTPLQVVDEPIESFSYPAWSPDGQSIYYTRTIASDRLPSGAAHQIERMPLGGSPEVILQDVIWSSISLDGSKMAYLSIVLATEGNDLMIADASGENASALMPPRTFLAVDDHVFAPDGKSILFSAVNEGQAPPTGSLPDRFSFGVIPVQAHDLPSDWFRVDIETGQIQQITNIQQTGLYAAYSPDGKKVAFISQQGIFVMKPDGSDLLQIARIPASGSLAWVP